jgi:hypothetical protein
MISDNGQRKIAGYAARFNEESEDMGGWKEVLRAGSFDDVLDNDVLALMNHNADKVLGRTPQTLRLRQDEFGLFYEFDVPAVTYADDLVVSMQRNDINKSSFGFSVSEDSWDMPTPDRPYPLRVISKIKRLYDVSVVAMPAYPSTSSEVRAKAKEIMALAAETQAKAKEIMALAETTRVMDQRISEFAAPGRATGAAHEQKAAGRLSMLRKRLQLTERQ